MSIKLTEHSKGGGCGCKISPAILSEILAAHNVGAKTNVKNYDATLNGWGAEDQVRQPNVTLDAGLLQFSRSSRAARTRLSDPSGSNWTIVDGGVQG
jgi:hypothetical protein